MSEQMNKLGIQELFPPVSTETWMKDVEKALKGVPFEKKLIKKTYEGLAIQPLYTDESWPHAVNSSGLPGFYPFTRGSSAASIMQNGWKIGQAHSHPSIQKNNQAIKYEVTHGVTAVSLHFDDAVTTSCLKQPCALLGKNGIILQNKLNLQTLISGIDLTKVLVTLEAGSSFFPVAATMFAVIDENKIEPSKVNINFNADPLSALAKNGYYSGLNTNTYAELANLTQHVIEHFPKSTCIGVSTVNYHNAGATATQELAYALATGVEYIRELTKVNSNISVENIAKQMVFQFSVGCDFFLEIAKLRAARKLWANILTAFGINSPIGMQIHSITSDRMLTKRDPWVNMLRTTVGSFAAAVSGSEQIIVSPFDAAIGEPNDFSLRIARNTQIILQEESHLNAVIDPAGGSWYVEKITDELTTLAWAMFQEIEKQGGMQAALVNDFVQNSIKEVNTSRNKNIANRKDPILGVSEFPNLSEEPVNSEKINFEKIYNELPKISIPAKDAELFKAELDKSYKNNSPCIKGTTFCMANNFSIQDVLNSRQKFHATETVINKLKPIKLAAAFEELRSKSDSWLQKHGIRPRVCLLNLGDFAQYSARETFAKNFIEAGGLEANSTPSCKTADEALAAFNNSNCKIAILCSADTVYEQLASEVATKLKQRGISLVVIAGNPGVNEAKYRESGIEHFIFMGSDVLASLATFQQALGC